MKYAPGECLFSSRKTAELRKWLAGTANDALAVVALYGPCGTGKRVSLEKYLLSRKMEFEEVSDPPASFSRLIGLCFASQSDNLIVPLQHFESSDVEAFLTGRPPVPRPKASAPKRIFLIFSDVPVPVLVKSVRRPVITPLRIPRVTDRVVLRVLQGLCEANGVNSSKSSPTSRSLERIVAGAAGDLRQAVQQVYWEVLLESESLDLEAHSRNETLLPSHVSLKLLCGKAEYRATGSFGLLDKNSPHVLLENLWRNMLAYLPVRMESGSGVFDQMSTMDAQLKGNRTSLSQRMALLAFVLAYQRGNPVPEKSSAVLGEDSPPAGYGVGSRLSFAGAVEQAIVGGIKGRSGCQAVCSSDRHSVQAESALYLTDDDIV